MIQFNMRMQPAIQFNIGPGGRTVCPRRLSVSSFVVLMSTTKGEKVSLLGQTVLPPEPRQFFKKEPFFWPPFSFDNVLIFNFLNEIGQIVQNLRFYQCCSVGIGGKLKIELCQITLLDRDGILLFVLKIPRNKRSKIISHMINKY